MNTWPRCAKLYVGHPMTRDPVVVALIPARVFNKGEVIQIINDDGTTDEYIVLETLVGELRCTDKIEGKLVMDEVKQEIRVYTGHMQNGINFGKPEGFIPKRPEYSEENTKGDPEGFLRTGGFKPKKKPNR